MSLRKAFFQILKTITVFAPLPSERLSEIGRRSRVLVACHHSFQTAGRVFDGIIRSLGITPSFGGHSR